jgi:uncharacterized membrane protein YccC
MKPLRAHIHDPDRAALKGAARAAIVMPAVFAVADKVIGQPDTTIFAAFGSIAILVLTDLSGPPRKRLVAYLGLAAAGAGLITLGTLCSQTPWLAVAAMAVVGFVILFSGVISAYFAGARTAAMLTFILPVAIPAPASALPERLEGWALAAVVGIGAAMLLWPAHPQEKLRKGAADASRALANLLDAELSGDTSAIPAAEDAATVAVHGLRRSFVATPFRPTGPTGSTEALAFLVDAFEWFLSLASPAAGRNAAEWDPCDSENREVTAASVAVLGASASNLEGRRQQPDLDRLERGTAAVASALLRRIADPQRRAGIALPAAMEPSSRAREMSSAAQEIGVNALLASGAEPDGEGDARARSPSALRATATLLREHASPRSAWFRNSLRGAAALTAAVLVIETTSLQHSFWVVLATLSVLRSSAPGTGATIFSALAGTVAGVVVGGLIVIGIGSDEPLLWAVLPPAILVAAYAPRAVSFAAGQAGFSLVVLIVFNIIAPTGWTVGLLRAEDVAIGCTISLVVGFLFWPRGLGKLFRESLGAAYERNVDYVASAARGLVGGDAAGRTDGDLRSARAAARGAESRLDDAFRQYLAEPAGQLANLDSVATLVAGSTRVRLAAYSMSTLSTGPERERRLDDCAQALTAETTALHAWSVKFAEALVQRKAIAVSERGVGEDGGQVVLCVQRALAAGDDSITEPALSLLWASQHLENLRKLEGDLAAPAAEFVN